MATPRGHVPIVTFVPILVVGIGLAGLFWQQNTTFQSFQANFLSLREHAEYQVSTRRELDTAKTVADHQIAQLQKQLDMIHEMLSEQCRKAIGKP